MWLQNNASSGFINSTTTYDFRLYDDNVEKKGNILKSGDKARVRQNDQNWPVLELKFNVHKHSKTVVIEWLPNVNLRIRIQD